jgi:hypothetical protein
MTAKLDLKSKPDKKNRDSKGAILETLTDRRRSEEIRQASLQQLSFIEQSGTLTR